MKFLKKFFSLRFFLLRRRVVYPDGRQTSISIRWVLPCCLSISAMVTLVPKLWHHVQPALQRLSVLVASSPKALPPATVVNCKRKTIPLSDGSTAEVNCDGHIEIQFDAERRLIRLGSGEAYFHVVRDPTRPFMVKVGVTTVTAVGTAFDLYAKGNTVRILELEGRVNVFHTPGESLPAAGQKAVPLAAGHRLDVLSDRGEMSPVTRLTPADIVSMTAWRQGEVIEYRLQGWIDQFERYYPNVRFDADARIRDKPISGVYPIESLDRFLGPLQKSFCIGVVSIPDESGGRKFTLTGNDGAVNGGKCQ